MKKCKAFYPVAGSRTAWIPCVRKVEEGTGFCRRHGDAIFGVMLGAIVYEEPVAEDEGEGREEKGKRDGNTEFTELGTQRAQRRKSQEHL